MILNRQVLVLNASYLPINICSVRRAMKLVCKGRAAVELTAPAVISTSRKTFGLPSVIRLTEYKRIPRVNRSVSPRGIKMRDRSTCQYCGAKLPGNLLTIDHVLARSRGGKNTWENLVASCFPCNNRKGDRTPEEAGMALARKPHQLVAHAKYRLLAADEKAWEPYLIC